MKGEFVQLTEEKPAENERVIVWCEKQMCGFLAFRVGEKWFSVLTCKDREIPEGLITHYFKVNLTEEKTDKTRRPDGETIGAINSNEYDYE